LVINGITAVGASAGCRHIGPRSNVLPAPIEAHRHDVEPLVRAELRSVLSAAIDDLPASYRCVIVLRDIEGLSAPETSTTLNLSIPNVKWRTHRARLRLRQRLTEYITRPAATSAGGVTAEPGVAVA
jgi:DNA-directed RNA polymerase specialized sigma24 family protein